MKGNAKVIDQLNARLADELAAINQYMVHSEMTENWKLEQLHKAIEQRAMTEMKHAEKLIERILYLEGRPIVNKMGKINIGSDVPAMHRNDEAAEKSAIEGYNASIKVAVDAGDNGTRELLTGILTDEEGHIDWLEGQFDLIEQMGLENYLAQQIYGA
jgi:bacterioferritin